VAWPLFRNVGLKVVALGLGISLWMTVSGQQVERNVLVQLQFRNVPAALELTGDTPRTVDVRMRGAGGLITQLEPGQVVATIDLTNVQPGVRIFPLTPEHISVPLGVQVLSVDPATLSLTLEQSASVRVPVKPTIDGQPADGYEVEEVSWTPKMVELVGPESRFRDHPLAITEHVSIAGATSTVSDNVTIGVSDPALRLRQAQSALVTIKIAPSRRKQK
jgi:YbbR domain-containing protein